MTGFVPNLTGFVWICLTSLVGYYWATDKLGVNSSRVKGELVIFPLILLEENAILPIIARADCSCHTNNFVMNDVL